MTVLAECERNEREGREQNQSRGKFFTPFAMRMACSATVVFGTLGLPIPAFAAGSWETSATQVNVGTLPLLAALGVGIAVAVGAVVAFLQMTAKGKENNDAASTAMEDQELFDDNSINDWSDEETSPNPEYEDDPLTDYTIPVTQILSYPTDAEPADEKEPRLCGIEGEHAGHSYRILNRRLTLGRDPSQCAILFPYEASEVSRVHCTLRFTEESRLFILEDNGSSNGTFLSNGERLKPGVKYELRTGERFSLSGKAHLFEVRNGEGTPSQG
ncbi:FHA domain-containing protein [Cohnella luojiensis]|uniref:FHA domain-containing protein n=1 Tax=Cohnella luojiensis TaxID=652876 RepID=A0A4Y8LRX8_9BACL|nr:FHA domain-containing protein [Cohnella luojiensis]TFE23660.1 FHA domain-containing protein [Cohnella luojiensis]